MRELFRLIKAAKLSLKKYIFMYSWCLFCAIAYTCSALIFPSIVGGIIDNGVIYNDFSRVLNNAAYLLLLGVLMIIFQHLQKMSFAKLSQDITVTIQTRLVEKITKTNYFFWKQHEAGDVHAIIEKDVNKLESLLSSVVNDAIISTFVALGVAIYLIYVDKIIGTLITILAIMFAVIQRKIGNIAKKEMIVLRNKMGDVSSFTNNIVNNSISIRLMGITKKILSEYRENVGAQRTQYLKQIKIMNYVQSTGMAFNTLGLFLIMLLGSVRVVNDELSVGVLFSLTIYLQRLYSPIVSLGSLYVSLKGIVPIINKLLDILENDKEVRSGIYNPTLPLKGQITMHNVDFKYEDSPEFVFRDLNLKIAQGEIIGIIGKNGSGKTSIIRLLSRICTPISGEILLDGKDIASYEDDCLDKCIGIMSQENYLPGWKLRDIFECEDNDIEKINYLMSYLSFPVDSFLNGLDSKIGENKMSLSGGEIQKIAFVRLILQDKKIYIMDEPTSALDEDSENRMIHLISTELNGKTCIIITHRKAVLEICDRVIELS